MKKENYTTTANSVPELHPEKVAELGKRIKNIVTYVNNINLTLNNLKLKGKNLLIQQKYPQEKMLLFYKNIEHLEALVLDFKMIENIREKSILKVSLYEDLKQRFDNLPKLTPIQINETYQIYKYLTENFEEMGGLEAEINTIQSSIDIISNAITVYHNINSSLENLKERAANIFYCDKYILTPLQHTFQTLSELKNNIAPSSSDSSLYSKIEEDCNLLYNQANHLKTLWAEFCTGNLIENLNFVECIMNPNITIQSLLATVLTFNQQANLLIGNHEDIEKNLKKLKGFIETEIGLKGMEIDPVSSSLDASFTHRLNITTDTNSRLSNLLSSSSCEMDVDMELIPPLEKLELDKEDKSLPNLNKQNSNQM